jgi:uncharacterized protein (TIGR02246 family)
VEKDKKNSKRPGAVPDAPAPNPDRNPDMEELYRRLEPELRRPKPNPEAITAALEAAQRLAAEADAEDAMTDAMNDVIDDMAQGLAADSTPILCSSCGYENRRDSKFCGMCGAAVEIAAASAGPQEHPSAMSPSNPLPLPPAAPMHDPRATPRPGVVETHHYHHHYHHHYFPGGHDATMPRADADFARLDPPREEKLRPNLAPRGDMSGAEAAVRRATQRWALACNTKHLDDLLDLYVADAMVLRSNHAPVRGASAIREFFVGLLDAGLGEVEIEPLRVEVAGDLAYEAGRCKALIPSATGKRREERGKYLWVCARQSNGDWKLTADCWSSDLTLTTLESDIPAGLGVKTNPPRKA